MPTFRSESLGFVGNVQERAFTAVVLLHTSNTIYCCTFIDTMSIGLYMHMQPAEELLFHMNAASFVGIVITKGNVCP